MRVLCRVLMDGDPFESIRPFTFPDSRLGIGTSSSTIEQDWGCWTVDALAAPACAWVRHTSSGSITQKISSIQRFGRGVGVGRGHHPALV
jgi:hypothetical protein